MARSNGFWQEALYRAETAMGPGRAFATPAEIRAYTEEVVLSDGFQSRWDVCEVEVEMTRASCSSASPSDQVVWIARHDRNQRGVLHEVAHVVTPGTGHTEPFVRAYLALVRQEMGFHAYGAFLSALEATEAFRGISDSLLTDAA